MAQFDLNWVGEYIPKLVVENDFLNQKLENDTYGIYYSVLFEGDADTFLLQAKKAPVEGQPEWGVIEMSKSGKSKRFKRVKHEDGGSIRSSSQTGEKAFLKDMSNTPILMYNGSLNYAKESGLNLITDTEDRRVYLEYVKDITDEMLRMRDNILSSTNVSGSSNPAQDDRTKALPLEAAEPIHNKLRKGFGAVGANEGEPEFTEEDMP